MKLNTIRLNVWRNQAHPTLGINAAKAERLSMCQRFGLASGMESLVISATALSKPAIFSLQSLSAT